MIFIPGNVPSSKNSKQWTGKCLINSKTTRNYIKATEGDYLANKVKFKKLIKGKEKPYRIKLYFIRDTRRHFDYINVSQIIFDLMIKYGFIEDDDMNNVIPVFSGYEVNKEKTGVIIDVE